MAPQLHRNCTSERSACSFLEPFPQTNTYCQLAEGAPPHAAKDCAFLRFTASAFPIYALIKKTTSLRCFHSRNRLSKKSRRKRFVPSDTSVSSWDHFAIHSHLLLNRRGSAASNKGFTSNGRLVFSPPPPHGDTPALRISFTSQTPQESQRLIPTSPLIAMTKTLFFSSQRRSCCRGRPFSHSGGQVFPHNRHRFPKE